MSYPHSRHQIHELVQAPKVVRENARLVVEKHGEHGGKFDVNLDLMDGPFVDLRYLGKATDQRNPDGYEANLILAGHRVRGVGHNHVGRNNLRAKQRIPAGWHQNKVDPNLPTFHGARKGGQVLTFIVDSDGPKWRQSQFLSYSQANDVSS